MGTRRFVLSCLVVICLALSLPGAVTAQDPVPPDQGPSPAPGGSEGLYLKAIEHARTAGKANLDLAEGIQVEGTGESGTPYAGYDPQAPQQEIDAEAADSFGYKLKAVPYNWLSLRAMPGVQILDFSSEDSRPLALPFDFKFYDNTYSSVNVSLYGYLTFSQYPRVVQQSTLKWASEPNNVIAPYWTALLDTAEGDVFYHSGGDAPNRWFAVEWNSLSDRWTWGDNSFIFETILYENGNILFQYNKMQYTWGRNYATAGIEDSTGTTGLISLKYKLKQKALKAYLFIRPVASASVKMFPLDYGLFAYPGGAAEYKLHVKNTGELGDDVFDVKPICGWPILAYAADGSTLLTDTDGDRKIDTGPVASGAAVDVVIKVTPLLTAKLGSVKNCTVSFTSSLKTSRRVIAKLATTIPTTFAQAYVKDYLTANADDRGFYSNGSQIVDFPLALGANGYSPSVHERSDGNQVFAWAQYACPNANCENVVYQVMDRAGNIAAGPFTLRSNPDGTFEWGASSITAPNGMTGMVFMNEVKVPDQEEFIFNVYFTAIDAAGTVVVPPVNLSENTDTFTYDGFDGVYLWFPRIAVTSDNRFFVTWSRYVSDNYQDDVFVEVLNSDGSVVLPRTNFTNDPADDISGFYDANVTALTGGRVLLAYNGWRVKGRSWSEYAFYAVLNNDGTVYKPEYGINLGRNDSGWMDAVQMSNGQIVMVWKIYKSGKNLIQYALLKDTTYVKAKGPVPLSIKAALVGIANPSVTRDASEHAVITWMDADDSFGKHLYYAMLGKNGTILTKPVIMQTAGEGEYLYVTEYGTGNAPYSPLP